jgi:tRNA1(Val) A37 N6-methylase TrmN6
MSRTNLQDKRKEIAFFDAHAVSAEYDVFAPEANARLIVAFVRLSGLPRGARVADLGCGSGGVHRIATERGICCDGV